MSVSLKEPGLRGRGKDQGRSVKLNHRKSIWSPGGKASPIPNRGLTHLDTAQPQGGNLALGVLLNFVTGWPESR